MFTDFRWGSDTHDLLIVVGISAVVAMIVVGVFG